MLITRLGALVGVLLFGAVQGMELELDIQHEGDEFKSSGEHYRQLVRDEQKKKEELLTDIKTSLQADNNFHATVKAQVQEKRERLNLPPSFLEVLDKIQDWICPPEQLFTNSIPKKPLIDINSIDQRLNILESYNVIQSQLKLTLKRKSFEAFSEACAHLKEFIDKWQKLSDVANYIQVGVNQCLVFDKDWQVLITQIKNGSSPMVQGNKFYQYIADCHTWQHDLRRLLAELKSQNILVSDHVTIQQLISFFQQRGAMLWEIAKTHVKDIPPDFIQLKKKYMAKNPVNDFFCLSGEGNIHFDNISEDLLEKLKQTFMQSTLWNEKLSTLKANLQPYRNVKFIVTSLAALVKHYEKFAGMCDMARDNLDDLLSPWVCGAIDGHSIRLPKTTARRVLGLDSDGLSNAQAVQPCSQDELIFTQVDLPSIVEMNALYWFGRLFNLDSNLVSFGVFADTTSVDRLSETLQIPELRYFMVQKRSKDIQFSEFFSEVSLGRASFDQLHPHAVGKYFLYGLLMGSMGFQSNFRLVPNGNKFDLKLAYNDLKASDSYLKYKLELINEDEFGYGMDNLLPFLPWVKQQIPDEVKKTFQSKDILFILLSWPNASSIFGDYWRNHLMTTESLATVRNGYAQFAELVPLIFNNFNMISNMVNESNITYDDIFMRFHNDAYKYCKKEFAQHSKSFEEDKSKFYFDEYMFNTLSDFSDVLLSAQRLKVELDFSQFDLVDFSNEREKTLTNMKQKRDTCDGWIAAILSTKCQKFYKNQYLHAQERGVFEARVLMRAMKDKKPIRKKSTLHSRSSSPMKRRPMAHLESFRTSGVDSPSKETVQSRSSSPLQRSPIVQQIKSESFRHSGVDSPSKETLQSRSSSPLQRSPIVQQIKSESFRPSGANSPSKETVQSRSSSPSQRSPIAQQAQLESSHSSGVDSPLFDIRAKLIMCADLTSRPSAEAIEILSLLLGLNKSRNKELFQSHYHKSWNDWMERSMSEFMALPRHVKDFFQLRLQYNLHMSPIQLERNQLILLRNAQSLQWRNYQKVIEDVETQYLRSDRPIEEVAIRLFEELWYGGLYLSSEQDRRLYTALSDLLHLRHLGFASHAQSRSGPIQLTSRTGDHYVLLLQESWVKLFGSSRPYSFEMRKAVLSHNLTLFYLSLFFCMKKIDPSITFHSWFETLIQKSHDAQTEIWENYGQPFDQSLEYLWPEIFCKLQQKFQTHNNNRDSVLRELRNSSKVPEPLENQGSDFDWIPLGHTRNFQSILEDWDSVREFHDATPSLSLTDVATVVLNCARDDGGIFDENRCLFDVEHQILKLASSIAIDVPKVTNERWRDPDLLRALLDCGADDQVIRLAIALRLGCDIGNVQFNDGYLKIIGLKNDSYNTAYEIIRAFSFSGRNVTSLDLAGNQFLVLDEELSKVLQQLVRLKRLILSHNPICDPTPLKRLVDHPTLEEIVFEGTFVPQFHGLNIYFSKSVQNRKVTWRNASAVEKNNFELSIQEKGAIFDKLLDQLFYYYATEDSTKLFGAYERFNAVASILEDLGDNFWGEALAAVEKINKRFRIDELFLALDKCNRARQNPQDHVLIDANLGIAGKEASVNVHNNKRDSLLTLSDTDDGGLSSSRETIQFEYRTKIESKEIHFIDEQDQREYEEDAKPLSVLPIQDVAYKLLFALKYNCCLPGINKNNLGFAVGSDKRPIIIDNPYCLTSLTLCSDLSNVTLGFLSQFSGTYQYRNLGRNPKDCSYIPTESHVSNLYLLKTPSTSQLFCAAQGKKGIELSNNKKLRKFMDQTNAKKLLERVQTHVSENKSLEYLNLTPLTNFLIHTNYIFSGLQTLILFRTNISTIHDLPKIEALLALDLSENNLTDLEGFYIAEGDEEEAYKFPNLRWLNISKNKIVLTQEHYDQHFRRHFQSLSALDMSYNQLSFVPTMEQKWFQPNPNPIYLKIDHNNIPVSDLYKLYQWNLCEKDPLGSRSEKEYPRNSICLYLHEEKRSNFNLYSWICWILGHEEAQTGTVSMPEGSDQHAEYGLNRLFKQFLKKSDSFEINTITESEKEGIIKFIIQNKPVALNTQFLCVWPQNDSNTILIREETLKQNRERTIK